MKLSANLSSDRFEFALEAVRRFAGRTSARIVDIGAGEGRLRSAVESLGHTYRGFDLEPSSRGIEKWDLDNALEIGEKADVVLFLEVVEHLWNPRRCVEHVADVLRPGGHLVLTTPNPRWSRGRFDLLIRDEMACFTRNDLEVNHHVFTGWPHVIERLLDVTGFDVIEYSTLESCLPWPNRPLSPSYPARIVKHALSKLVEASDAAARGMGYGVIAMKREVAPE